MELDRQQVQCILPHRDPMLLVDGTRSLTPGVEAEAFLFVDPARDIFLGHFPGGPVLPGVYTVEAMAQTADLALLTLPRYSGKAPLLIGIDGVRLVRRVIPGETLTLIARVERERPDKAIVTCRCTATVDGQPAAEAVITLAFR